MVMEIWQCHAKYYTPSLSFMLSSCQALGRELYVILRSYVDGVVEIKYF